MDIASKKMVKAFTVISLLVTVGLSPKAYQPRTKENSFSKRHSQKIGDLNLIVNTSKKRTLLRDYQPINLTFTNTGSEKYLLKAEHIGLKLLTKSDLDIISKKRFHILPFTAIISSQIFTVGQLIAGTLSTANLAIAVPIITIGTLFTTTLHQFRIKKINSREKRVFQQLRKGVEIEPYSVRKITLHIRRHNFKPKFDIGVINALSQIPTRFDVNLMQKVDPSKTPKVGTELGIKSGKDLSIYKKKDLSLK